jgi:hypothetical protein
MMICLNSIEAEAQVFYGKAKKPASAHRQAKAQEVEFA